MIRWAFLFWVCATVAWADSRLVVLRGDAGGNRPLEFVADETSLSRAQLGGVSGQELLALKGQRLLEQAEVYRAAQGVANPAPLYVVLEPSGTWAYASPWGTFSYLRDGKRVGPVTTPYLKLGEQMDHRGQAVDPGEESAVANRELVEKARAFYERELKAKGVKRIPDFERDVLDRLTVSSGGPYVGLSKATGQLSTERFATYLQRTVASDLDSYRIDGNARWAAFARENDLPATIAAVDRAMLQRGVAETVAHELGHVIQFAALGLYQYKGAALGVHMPDNGHTLQTLSTPEFALVEGWGEANSMVVVGLPKERTPGAANRIDYGSTVSQLEALIKHVKSQPERAAELPALNKALAYVTGLQSRRGELRSRYDFLRSEFAVANALAKLREALGLDAVREVCATLARRKPRDLAALIEAFVHDHPARRLDTYRVLATATEGILVTPAQVAALERASEPLEIDFDQDGRVPGKSANAALPAAFPRDIPEDDPLPLARPRTGPPAAATALAEESVQLAPPSGERTIPAALEPEMDGLERH